jgi:shikimate dehydrogenase
MQAPSAATRLIALLGDPVAHSLSPVFQNAALAHLGLDGVYLALRCRHDQLAGLLSGVARAGGGGNVTLPHKEAAARLVERPTEAVLRTACCNTFWLEDDRVCGDNTDVAGFRVAAESLLRRPVQSARVLLLGAGGAARAAAYALVLGSAAEVVILNRSAARAEELRSSLNGGATAIKVESTIAKLRGESFDLVVNATSLGLRADDPLPLGLETGIRTAAALDLVYRPGLTRWAREQQAHGVPAADGLEMLLQQGVAAFRHWWDVEPPVEVRRAALA